MPVSYEQYKAPESFGHFSGAQFQALLSTWLQFYHDKNLQHQFPLQLPKNSIKKINDYRDDYFPYLKDSVYKSNICYLLQNIDFQLWLYQVFRPKLSLANSFFFQQLVNLGIVCEALVTAIILDPLIQTHGQDRSQGDVADNQQSRKRSIVGQEFNANLKWLRSIKALNEEILDNFEEARIVRNSVHIQNWEGRIYESLDYDYFKIRLKNIQKLLLAMKQNPPQFEKIAQALNFSDMQEGEIKYNLTGKVLSYDYQKKFGFILFELVQEKIFFHASKCHIPLQEIRKDKIINFDLQKNSKGFEAIRVDEVE